MKRESWFNKCNFGPKSQWKAIQKQQLFKYYSLFIFNLHWRIVLGRTITVYPYRTLSPSSVNQLGSLTASNSLREILKCMVFLRYRIYFLIFTNLWALIWCVEIIIPFSLNTNISLYRFLTVMIKIM